MIRLIDSRYLGPKATKHIGPTTIAAASVKKRLALEPRGGKLRILLDQFGAALKETRIGRQMVTLGENMPLCVKACPRLGRPGLKPRSFTEQHAKVLSRFAYLV